MSTLSVGPAKALLQNAIKTLTVNDLLASGEPLQLQRVDVPVDLIQPHPISDLSRSRLPQALREGGVPPRLPSTFPPAGSLELSCSLGPPVGAGSCSTVFGTQSRHLCDSDVFVPPLVLKTPRCHPYFNLSLAREKWFYDEMETIQGIAIARCYGLFAVDVPDELNGDVRPWQYPYGDFDFDHDSDDLSLSDAGTHAYNIEIMKHPNRLYILVLERLGDMLPIGESISEADRDDIRSLYRDIGHLGVYVDNQQVGRWNILRAPVSPPGLTGRPSSITQETHNWRLIDFAEASKSEFTEERIYDSHMTYVETLLDGLPLWHQPEW